MRRVCCTCHCDVPSTGFKVLVRQRGKLVVVYCCQEDCFKFLSERAEVILKNDVLD